MRRPWRWLFIGIAVLLLLLLALGAFFVATFDANSHKARVASLVKDKIGRELSIPGNVRLKLFPNLRLELDRAVLNEKNSARPFATIEAVKLSLRPLPLLRSQVMLGQVEIGNFDIGLKRFADGTTNFDDLISKDQSPSTLHIDLAGLTIQNGSLRFDDELGGRKMQLSEMKVTSGRLTDNLAAPIAAKFFLSNDNPPTALQTELTAALKFDLQRKHYQLNRIQVTGKGEVAGIKPFKIGVRADIDADLSASRISAKNLNTVIDGRAGTQALRGEFAILRMLSEPNKLTIEQTKAQLKIDESGRKIDLIAAVPSVVAGKNRIDAPNIKLNYVFDQDTLHSAGELNAALNIDLTQQRVEVPTLTLSSKTSREQLTVGATATGLISLDLKSGELNAKQFNGEWQMQKEQDQLKGKWRLPLLANIADGNFSVDAFQGDWSGKFADAEISGKVALPVQGNWQQNAATIPTIDLQTNVTWSDSALEASIHADLEASPQSDQVAAKGVSLKASGHYANGKWQVNIVSPVRVDFANQFAELTALTGQVNWVGVSKPAKRVNVKLNGKGGVDLVRELARFNLKAALDQSKFVGEFGVAGWADPAYQIDARLDQLDLDRYFPPAAETSVAKPIQKKAPPTNLDLTFLKPLKIDGQIKIGVLKSAGTTARNVRIEMESAHPKKTKP